jgi:hypothetical protein
MATAYTDNRLSAAKKQLLVSKINGLDSIEMLCNIMLQHIPYRLCKLHCFACRIVPAIPVLSISGLCIYKI